MDEVGYAASNSRGFNEKASEAGKERPPDSTKARSTA